MKRLFILAIISCLFILPYSWAQEMRIVGGETHSTIGELSPTPTATSPEASSEVEQKKKPDFIKKLQSALDKAKKTSIKDLILQQRASKNLSEQMKNFRLEQLRERAKEQIHADKIDQTIRIQSKTWVPHKVAFASGKEYITWIGYFNEKVFAILGEPLNTGRKVNFAHFLVDKTVGDNVAGTASPTTNFTDYIRLLYEDDLIDYQKISDGIYTDDELNEYNETLITVEKEGLEDPLSGQEDVTIDEVDEAYDRLKDIASDIEGKDTLKTEKEHRNIIRSETTDATDGTVISEDVTIKTNEAPDAPETQHVVNEWIEKDKPAGASEVIPDEIEFPHHEQGFKENEEKEIRTKEAVANKIVTTSTVLGLTTVIETSVIDFTSFNEPKAFNEIRKTEAGDLIREDKYSSIERNDSGDITSYNLESTIPNGIKKDIEVRNIEYDDLKRVTKKDVTEKIDSSKWTYNYSDFAYNNLWQITGFKVKITDPNAVITDRVQSGMLYDSKGLLTNVTRIDVTGTETETTNITYAYGDDGLLSEIIYQVTIENGTAKESHYKRWGDFIYNASRQITRYNYVDIKRTGVLEFLDFKTKITDLLSSISDTYPFTTTTLNLASLGFTASDTVTIEKWRNISYASPSQTDILTSAQIEDELARLSAFNSITSTTTLTTATITTSNR